MHRSDLEFELPPELIAQAPLPERSASRLLVLDPRSRAIAHHRFADIESLLGPDDLLVVNDTRVIPARLHGTKDSGGRVEILIERLLDEFNALAHVRASKPLRPGRFVALDGTPTLLVMAGERVGDLFEVCFPQPALDVLSRYGHVPLPPYITREDDAADRARYQTVFAAKDGAVAAPTAGLHFDAALLERLHARGVQRVAVTLHVGAGTFQPLRADNLDDHVMHAERYEVDETVVAAIAATRARGGRVVAVGTTVVRALESAALASPEALRPGTGDTSLFIRPGFRFHVVDALLTNFHLPGSTLIALVAAFAGHGFVMDAYREAVRERYRFFSYGDAMFIAARASP
jgi:S-adenosylmethionine:tRNA ribosyltransferase-isomerase